MSSLRWPDWFFQAWLKGIVTNIQSSAYDLMRIQEEFIVIYLLPRRRKGLIINISSIVGTHLLPLLTLYSSTKVFSHPDVMLTSHRYSDIYTQIFVTMSRSGAQLHNTLWTTRFPWFQVFVSYFSRCLHAEYKSKGVTVQVKISDKCIKCISFMRNSHFEGMLIF